MAIGRGRRCPAP